MTDKPPRAIILDLWQNGHYSEGPGPVVFYVPFMKYLWKKKNCILPILHILSFFIFSSVQILNIASLSEFLMSHRFLHSSFTYQLHST